MERHRGYWGGSPGEALSRIGPDAVPLLVKSMQRRRRRSVQFGAADVLEELGPRAEAAVPELIEMLDAKDSTIRLKAVFVLKEIGPNAAAAVPALAAMRKDEQIGALARDALTHFGKSAVPTLVADLPETIGLLGSMGPEAKGAIPALEALLDKKHEDSIRFTAAEAMAAIGGDTDVILPVMREMLESGRPEVRLQAIRAMRDTALDDRTSWMVDSLRKSLNDPDRQVRFAAARALLTNFRATAKETLPVLGEMLVYDDSTRIINTEAARAVIMLLGRAEEGEE
jgi:HEAT repeat protein